MHRIAKHSAFTLIELIVVMLIIATALAVAAPSLRGWSRGAKLRDETDQFLSVARWARAQSIATATPYRMVVDGSNARYWLMRREGGSFIQFEGEFGQIFQMPTGYTIDMVRAEPMLQTGDGSIMGDAVIDFTPIGKTDVAQVQIVSDRGQSTLLACNAPYDVFRRVTQTEGVQ